VLHVIGRRSETTPLAPHSVLLTGTSHSPQAFLVKIRDNTILGTSRLCLIKYAMSVDMDIRASLEIFLGGTNENEGCLEAEAERRSDLTAGISSEVLS
jgi:hypothetical protein